MQLQLIAANLKRARQALRLSQTTVGRELGVPRQAISAIEAGERELTLPQLLKLANLYRLSWKSLLETSPPTKDDLVPSLHRRARKSQAEIEEQDAAELRRFAEDLKKRTPVRGLRITAIARARHTAVWPLVAVADEVRKATELESAPINVYRALACFGVYVRMTTLARLSGAFVAGGASWPPGILINSDQPTDRQRFSVAHELGHFLLGHAEQSGEITSPLGRRFEPREVEADTFAAELLMPRNLLEKELRHVRKFEKLEEQVFALADRFLVSFQAMVYRLVNVGMVAAGEKRRLLTMKPSAIESHISLKRSPHVAFDPSTLGHICKSANILPTLLQTVDGVRQLQEVAFEDYVGRVAEQERADSAGGVYEAVARWVAEHYPMPEAA